MTDAFIIGLRKSGTTWLYENFKNQAEINVSHKVKESGFLINPSMDLRKYDELFEKTRENQTRIEIETRAFESKYTLERLKKFNQNARVALILREPSSYYVSRIIHGLRKGELLSNKPYNYTNILEQNKYLLKEYDVERIEYIAENLNNFKVFYYEDLLENAEKFYNEIVQFLTANRSKYFRPTILEPLNQARLSNNSTITIVYTIIAQFLRKNNLHSIVNRFRNSVVRTRLEQKVKIGDDNVSEMEIYLHRIGFKFPRKYQQ